MGSWKQIGASRALLARESGTVHKDPGGKLTVALAYPNTYFVGMSSLALHILYRAFNERPDVVCERVFSDAGQAKIGLPLLSLESQTPVQGFDIWAFSVSFEMDYFNIPAMLAQAGVPPLAAERARDGRWPLLIGGGPGLTMNPEPLAPFFDAILIGEVEGVLDRLIDILRGGAWSSNRQAVLDALDAVPGIYVPERITPHSDGRRIRRLWVRDLAATQPFSALYTPDTEFGGMHLIEIARGCARGCRYCLAGHAYRPPRQQPLERVLELARRGMREGGRIGLVAAAVSDYPHIDTLATELQRMGARISVSSMRTDPLSVPLVEAMACGGTQTLTIAPEAGTERLRRAINKPQSESSLLQAAELAQRLNFSQLKMYFMVGHPTEQDEDVQGIIDLTMRVKAIFRRNLTINATPFVPKAHTPFQWSAMTPARDVKERQNRLKRGLTRHQVAVNADSSQWAEVQAVLARGDRRLAPVLLACALSGDVSASGFMTAMQDCRLKPGAFLGARSPEEYQPWQVVESGVSLRYLQREHRLAFTGQASHSCQAADEGCPTCDNCSDIHAGHLLDQETASP